MRAAACLHALAILLASASLIFNAQILGMWYDRVGHIFINGRLYACIIVVEIWNALAVAYFVFTTRFRRSAKSDVVSLGLLSVLGFSAASASTAAGYLELAQCAGYNSRCAMGTTGGVLNWVTAAYFLALLTFKMRHAVSWPEEEPYALILDEQTDTSLPSIPEMPESPGVNQEDEKRLIVGAGATLAV